MKRILMTLVLVLGFASLVFAETAYQKAKALYSEGKYAESIPEYEKAVTEADTEYKRAHAQYQLGWAYGNVKDDVNMKASFEKVVKNFPSMIHLKAKSLFYLGRYKEAVPVFDAAIGMYNIPSYKAEFTYRKGKCQLNIGLKEAANETFLSVLVKYPEQAEWAGKSLIALTQNKGFEKLSVDEITTILENLLKSIPATLENAKVLGNVKSELGKYK